MSRLVAVDIFLVLKAMLVLELILTRLWLVVYKIVMIALILAEAATIVYFSTTVRFIRINSVCVPIFPDNFYLEYIPVMTTDVFTSFAFSFGIYYTLKSQRKPRIIRNQQPIEKLKALAIKSIAFSAVSSLILVLVSLYFLTIANSFPAYTILVFVTTEMLVNCSLYYSNALESSSEVIVNSCSTDSKKTLKMATN